MGVFSLESDFAPSGDQDRAIAELVASIEERRAHQTLLGVTGSGKTFTVANAIAQLERPALILSPNKTLAAQLYGEFRSFFPKNAVEYFISYYDYYQPEAYLPTSDTYIAKDASINEQIERLRLRATASLLERRDVIVVASVSCIYGLGDPEMYRSLLLMLWQGQEIDRDEILRRLVQIQYERNDVDLRPGTFRVRGDVIEVVPIYEDIAVRIEIFGDEVERITRFEPLTGAHVRDSERVAIYPAKHFVTSHPRLEAALLSIESELVHRLEELEAAGKQLEAQRLRSRTRYDLEMLRELGYCSGIENYSLHLSRRRPGERPACLLDFFPPDFLTVIDESHVGVPQINGMYRGDRSRKETLVEHGFRLPSALDNRPLRFDEFEDLVGQVVFASATPGDYEVRVTGGRNIEQIIRPTGLVDPEVDVRPVEGQIDNLMEEVRVREARGERVLVTTLTKRMSEDLTDFLVENGVRARYLHSEIDALERVELLRDLRLGKFSVLVGINLLREGLDLPEVSLVAVLDADKEGFLRSTRSLIQTSGRAARNVEGRVIFYADRITGSMQTALDEMERRRAIQLAHNEAHGIVPRSIVKEIGELLTEEPVADVTEDEVVESAGMSSRELAIRLEAEMRKAADALEFERAAVLRDRLVRLRDGGMP